jgi:hypothetical protein
MPKPKSKRKYNKSQIKSTGKSKKETKYSDIDYYQIAFAWLHGKYKIDINHARSIESRLHLTHAISLIYPCPPPCPASWGGLFEVLKLIEKKVAELLSRRSVFYWQHIYRRLSPGPVDGSAQARKWNTISLVRDMVESAIQKYGALQADGEFGLSNEVSSIDVLGGLFEESLVAHFPEDYEQGMIRKIVLDRPATVIIDFSPRDLIDVYLVESLTYQYWNVTTKMRALGKGAKIDIMPGGQFLYDDPSTPWALMRSFDERSERSEQFDRSSLGIWIEPIKRTHAKHLTLTFSSNSRNDDVYSILREMGLEVTITAGGHNANYAFSVFDASEFCRRHSYLSSEFKEKRGFSLESLAIVFESMSARLINGPSAEIIHKVGASEALALSMMNLLKRAYSLKSAEVYEEVFAASVLSLSEQAKIPQEDAESEARKIFEALTLSDQNRNIIGIWSRGPRFPIQKFGDGYIFDFFGIHRFFHNLFVGIKEPKGSPRGYIFEDAFRKALTDNDFKLEVRDFTFEDGTKAEADAVFYVGSRLVVVDCLSVWMPLDFDIARPKTIDHRNRAIQTKLCEALPRVEKLRAKPKGKNFDFSDAEEIVALVASPFVEWLWSDSSDLWLNHSTPRVMRANELIEWAINLRATLPQDER